MPIRRPPFLLACVGLVGLAAAPTGDEPGAIAGDSGEAIYSARCASCHGAKGEGTPEEYPNPLTGKRSVAQLATLVARTMPADDPGALSAEESEAVSSYIYDAFYSPTAQDRNRPARVDLSRLTVRQYRNAVADLIGSFRTGAGPGPGAERGLKGEYFDARNFRDKARRIERTDPEVRFDFGEAGPGPEPEKFDPSRFSIRWEGSVLAPETGEYEFIVRTEHAARLWVDDPERPLIDAWVKSGDDTEYRGSIFLLEGRAYPIRLEFSKAKQGVDDSKDRKEPPPAVKATIALAWKPPHLAEGVIPQRHLSPEKGPEVFVVTTPFPPDDRSIGYERGTSVSKAWEEATTEAAIEAAGYVAGHLGDLAGTSDDATDREANLRDFALRFAERAFRRPLSDEMKALYLDRRFEGAPDPETGVKRVVLMVLKSPRFFYPDLRGGNDPYVVASRLSFALWDSLPDPPLLEAAASGRLARRDQVIEQARRMLDDPRAHSKLRLFLLQWLQVDPVPDLAKDADLYPGFTEEVVSDLRASLELSIDDILWGDRPDFRRLMAEPEVFLNGRLAAFYGADLPAEAPFQKVALDPDQRAGVLSHPYLMARFAYTGTSSPIHRGVFLARNVLGRTLRPPPEAVSPLAPDLHPDLSTRDRVTLQTSPTMCHSCHGMINPLGFALEHFDAVGRYRTEEKGRPVDATGLYQTPDGETTTFSGARELAEFLTGSEEAHDAFVEGLFEALVKQPILAYGGEVAGGLSRSFADKGFDIRELVVEVVATAALGEPERDAGRVGAVATASDSQR